MAYRWAIIDDFLGLLENDGSVLVPSAAEIYSIVFGGSVQAVLPELDSEDFPPGITFSRYPAFLELWLESDRIESICCITWSCQAITENHRTTITDVRERKADHILIDHCWFPLLNEELAEIRRVLHQTNIFNSGPLLMRQYLTLKGMSITADLVKDKVPERYASGKHGIDNQLIEPESFCGTLYPYQKDGLRWLKRIFDEGIGAILADEMGLGKTAQVIALLASARLNSRLRSLVVAPATILENWYREIQKFCPVLSKMIHQGPSRTGFPSELSSTNVVITSYDTLVRDLAMFRQIYWDIVVIDEAQFIKNPVAKRSLSVKKIDRKVSLAVTGTPLENHLSDLWSIIDFVFPNYLGKLNFFLETFSNDFKGASELEPIISPLILRRKLSEVAGDLPPKIEIPQAVCLDSVGANEYEELRNRVVSRYGGGAKIVALIKLRMYCTHPSLIRDIACDPSHNSPKYQRLLEILEEIFANRHKVLIFTAYTKMIDIMVRDLCQRFSVDTFFIDGRVPVWNRQNVVDQFSHINGSSILVLNPRAAGIGLNITAANHAIHYSLEWNPATEDQASARVYRKGQTLPVTVHRLYYSHTVDEIMNERLSRKRNLANVAVVGHEGSKQDITDILRAIQMSPLLERRGNE